MSHSHPQNLRLRELQLFQGSLKELFRELEQRYRTGDATALLFGLVLLEVRSLEGYSLPRWFLVALREHVITNIKNQPQGRTGNLMKRLLARAEDVRRHQLVEFYKQRGLERAGVQVGR